MYIVPGQMKHSGHTTCPVLHKREYHQALTDQGTAFRSKQDPDMAAGYGPQRED